jgi:hypothetical protein
VEWPIHVTVGWVGRSELGSQAASTSGATRLPASQDPSKSREKKRAAADARW